MRFVLFCHSLVSDWNHGNAHFLRGIVGELIERGHRVDVYEPRCGWSLENLRTDFGDRPLRQCAAAYPLLKSHFYDTETIQVDRVLDRADVVIVHEWNDPQLVSRIGEHRRRHGGYRLLFHDTHHRSATSPEEIARYDLRWYDGVLAFGDVIRGLYLEKGWAARAWTWHEAADTRVFYPRRSRTQAGDLVWIGNWGDNERTQELLEFLLRPVRDLGLRATVHGVRYPQQALAALKRAGIEYANWLPNFRVPQAFARHRVTVHVPRRPYREKLPGIPTIRMFEALACGIPLVSAPWEDCEGLFRAGVDYLVARDGRQMREHLHNVMGDRELARRLARSGRETIRARHTCAHRVDELMAICRELGLDCQPAAASDTQRNRRAERQRKASVA